MKVAGEARMRWPVEVVWDMLHNRAGQFAATTAMPAVSGTYAGTLTVTDRQRPNLLTLTASATGEKGTVTVDVILRLTAADDGTTLVTYEADGLVTGPLAAAGTRLLASAAQRVASEFFAAVDKGSPPRPVGPGDATHRPLPQSAGRRAGVTGRRNAIAIGVAGVIIGVLLGRRSRAARPGRA